MGVAAAAPAGVLTSEASSVRERDALETFTAAEAEAVEAIVDRLIPGDANGPGAAEARVARYIDRALGGELSSLRSTYSAGLAAVDSYAEERFGAPLADLSPTQQDVVLTAMEENVATGFPGGSRAFFELVREHCLQGMFGDPVHGGNEDFVGWDLIGFPGVKLGFSAAEQQMDVVVVPAHKSTADYPLFKRGRKRGNGEH
ncbi:MAG TPA: gluconate 2-dehydrogenase subunit 3 family protein [Gaiellaceae bacterium]|nr:gluconate 2-dehydrogenase subunit 3 family protein [Gaiellaceae bacterium]